MGKVKVVGSVIFPSLSKRVKDIMTEFGWLKQSFSFEEF